MAELIQKEHFEEVDDEAGYSYIGENYKIKCGDTTFSLTRYEDDSHVIITEPWKVLFGSADAVELIDFLKNSLFHSDIEIWHPGEDGYEPIPKL